MGVGEHAVCEEEGGKTASDLQSHEPRQHLGLKVIGSGWPKKVSQHSLF